MTIYFLFGPTGTGKSYVGDLLSKKTGLLHIDGDKYITPLMRNALAQETPITREMIDEFVWVLVDKIKAQLAKDAKASFIISQAMYMNEHRQILLDAFPGNMQLILIQSDEKIRKSRILSRYNAGKSKVTVKCAEEMDPKFEAPDHDFNVLDNNDQDELLYQAFESLYEIKTPHLPQDPIRPRPVLV